MGIIPQRAAESARTTGPIPPSEPKGIDPQDLDEPSLVALISFFRLVDRWDREAKDPC